MAVRQRRSDYTHRSATIGGTEKRYRPDHRDDRLETTAARQFERRLLVPPGLDQHIKNFALGIHGTPEVDQATIDLEIDFVEMPGRMRLLLASAKIGRE